MHGLLSKLKYDFEGLGHITYILVDLQLGPKVLDHSCSHIHQWLSLLPIFIVEPHHTGTDSTIIEHNIATVMGREILFLRNRFGITISSHNRGYPCYTMFKSFRGVAPGTCEHNSFESARQVTRGHWLNGLNGGKNPFNFSAVNKWMELKKKKKKEEVWSNNFWPSL